MGKFNQLGAIPVLVLIAVIGLISFLAISSLGSFKNNIFSTLFPKKSSQAFVPGGWTMAGANPQRTSWTSSEAPGDLNEEWVKPIEPYISQKAQVIAATTNLGNKYIFVSTSKGLYAFDSATGNEKWVYATELPLGHAPTYDNGTLYVGGLDRKLHAVDANTGAGKWTFSAEGGFNTNPLVIIPSAGSGQVVYAGNRDSYMYVINASDGSLKWKYKTDGQILQSAAASLDNSTIYFASMDAFGYALDANTGSLKWKSAKLPGLGFRSWWPVVYQDKVMFATKPESRSFLNDETNWLYPSATASAQRAPGILGTEPGNWPAGQITMDISSNPFGQSLPDYYETYHKRRAVIVINQSDGTEVDYDLDSDGIKDAIPAHHGEQSASSYPPVIGSDGVIYFRANNYDNGGIIPGAMASGWKIGTPFLSLPINVHAGQSPWWPFDEPVGMSSGGRFLYWNLCCDRFIAGVDLSIPNTTFPASVSNNNNNNRQWRYVNGTGTPPAPSMPAGYHTQMLQYVWNPDFASSPSYYVEHNDNVGPAIYDNALFVLRGNALIKFSPTGSGSTAPILPVASAKGAQVSPDSLTTDTLKTKLEDQIQKIISAGHLRSGYTTIGVIDHMVNTFPQANNIGNEDMLHYFHNPGENIYILLRALPHLNPTLQNQLKTYIQSEYNLFRPDLYRHIGFQTGASREPFDYLTPPADAPKIGMNVESWYALYKYAQEFGNAKGIFDTAKLRLFPAAPADTDQVQRINKHITGLVGYLELEKLAGYPQSATKSAQLNSLLAGRAQNLRWDVRANTGSAFTDSYYYSLITAWNFLYLVPELANYLNTNALSTAQSVVDKYEAMAPYWFVGENEEPQMENGRVPYQQTHTLFQAKAQILKQPQQDLAKYLDTPLYPVGDLYYIDNLVAALEAPSTIPSPSVTSSPTPSPTPTPTPALPGDIIPNGMVDIFDYNALLTDFGKTSGFNPLSDIIANGKIDIFDYNALLQNFGRNVP